MPKIKDLIRRFITKYKSLTRKKKIIVVVLIILVSIFIYSSIKNLTKEPPYKLEKAKIGNIEEFVSETGNISSNNKSDVYSITNGIVTEVLVKNGDYVEEGDLLFKVESSASEQEQKAAQASYLAALSALNSAKSLENSLKSDMFSKWQIFKDLSTNDTYETSEGVPKYDQRSSSEFHIAEENWLAAELIYKNQVTAISAASSDASSKQILYQATMDSSVKAPISGYVANLSVTDGSGVLIKQSLQDVPVLTITSSSIVEAKVLISESNIGKIKEGQSVSVDVNAVDGKVYDGIVRRVDSIGTNYSGVNKYAVYIELIDPDNDIKSGMTIDAKISTNKIEKALIVPSSSVKPFNGGRAVRIVDGRNKDLKYIPIEIGIRGKNTTQIISGINEGQEVVVSVSNENVKRKSLF